MKGCASLTTIPVMPLRKVLKAVSLRCSSRKVLYKYAASFWENAHEKERFQYSCPCLQDIFFEEQFWGTASESKLLNKVQLTLPIQLNVKLVKLS